MILSHCRCLVNHVFAIIALLHIRVLFVLIFLQTLSFGPDYLRTLLKYTGWPRLEMLPVQAVQYSVVVISMTTDKVRKVECPRLTQVFFSQGLGCGLKIILPTYCLDLETLSGPSTQGGITQTAS